MFSQMVEYEDKGCGDDKGLAFQHRGEMTNLCFSVFLPLHFPPISLSRVHKLRPGNTEREHQKEMRAFTYIPLLMHRHKHTDANAHSHAIHTHVSMRLAQWWHFAMKVFPQLRAL